MPKKISKKIMIHLIFILGSLFFGLIQITGIFTSMDLFFHDALMVYFGSKKIDPSIQLVFVNDSSIQVVNQKWPWSRKIFADALKAIAKDKPKVIAFDFTFSEPGTHEEDSYFSKAIRDIKPIPVIGAVNLFQEKTNENFNDKKIMMVQRGIEIPVIEEMDYGYINIAPDNDGTIRNWTPHKEFSNQIYSSFPLKIAEIVQQDNQYRENTSKQNSRIYYYGAAGSFSSISFSQIYEKLLPANYFHNKIVIIGATFSSSQDFHITPYTGKNPDTVKMPGVEINAHILNMILNHDRIKNPTLALKLFVLLLYIYGVYIGIMAFFQYLRPFYILIILSSFYLILSLLFWTFFSILIPVFLPLLSGFILYLLMVKINHHYKLQESKKESEILEKNQKFSLEPFFFHYKITQREKEIIMGILKEYTKAQMAKKLFISVHTVKKHIGNIYSKLGISSREELVSLISRTSKNL